MATWSVNGAIRHQQVAELRCPEATGLVRKVTLQERQNRGFAESFPRGILGSRSFRPPKLIENNAASYERSQTRATKMLESTRISVV